MVHMENTKEKNDMIKRSLRSLKKAEIRIRLINAADIKKTSLIWDNFFDLRNTGTNSVRYSFEEILSMDKTRYKAVIEEFYWNVYYRFYKDNYYFSDNTYQIESFNKLGLSIYADIEEIKSKFRQMAKKYHPDTGGSKEEFIELYNIYMELKNKYK